MVAMGVNYTMGTKTAPEAPELVRLESKSSKSNERMVRKGVAEQMARQLDARFLVACIDLERALGLRSSDDNCG